MVGIKTPEHFQAPWAVLWGPGDLVNPCKVYDSKHEYVATCATPDIARLTAAAPELLVACQLAVHEKLHEYRDKYGSLLEESHMADDPLYVALRAAIARARGV